LKIQFALVRLVIEQLFPIGELKTQGHQNFPLRFRPASLSFLDTVNGEHRQPRFAGQLCFADQEIFPESFYFAVFHCRVHVLLRKKIADNLIRTIGRRGDYFRQKLNFF
jgi:hypothetical protein